jgi:hypothetical protein
MVGKEFILAGQAIFTIQIPADKTPTGKDNHYTFRVDRVEASDRWPTAYFLKTLTGPNNLEDYTYVGKLNPNTGEVIFTQKSAFPETSFRVKLLRRTLWLLWNGGEEAIEKAGGKVHHEGRCGRCGRTLTVPSSIESGLGPVCAGLLRDDGKDF